MVREIKSLAILAALPLASVLLMLLARGVPLLSLELFTELPPGAGTTGGGIGNAIRCPGGGGPRQHSAAVAEQIGPLIASAM